MSFYSYKNANSDACPGVVNGNILSGLNQRVCVQVKNIYDSCMQQEQLDDERIVIENIVSPSPTTRRSRTPRTTRARCPAPTARGRSRAAAPPPPRAASPT